MEFTNHGTSVYHDIQALYTRGFHGNLLHLSGPMSARVEGAWASLTHIFLNNKDTIGMPAHGSYLSMATTAIPTDCQFALSVFGPTPPHGCSYMIYEMQRPGESQIVGLIFRARSDAGIDPHFVQWYIRLVLAETRLSVASTPLAVPEARAKAYAEAIVDQFERDLRNIAQGDMWYRGGREYFAKKVLFFTCHMAPVHFSLPAFPCKSSNTEKVTGSEPDKGEELAIRTLANFAEAVKKIYPPGARISVVSDGHVFSDCIGVNDDTVDHYNDSLIDMTKRIFLKNQQQCTIEFRGLRDLFFENPTLTSAFLNEFVAQVEVKHYVATKLSTPAELCRKVLIAGSQNDSAALRAQIDNGDKATLALYRGFSRFMLEDLMLHPSLQQVGRSQRKKLASRVAFEMIIRNQSYSNLLELLLPVHVRLSIHAHVNSGPKFGINLLPKAICRTLDSFDPILNCEGTLSPQKNTDDLLHLPTPWHNSVAQFTSSQDPTYYIVKSKTVHDVLSGNQCDGAWVPGSGAAGGYWALKKFPSIRPDGTSSLPCGMDTARTLSTISSTTATTYMPVTAGQWSQVKGHDDDEGSWRYAWVDGKLAWLRLGWDVVRGVVRSTGFI